MKQIKIYETNDYLVIIHYTNFETSFRTCKKEKLEDMINALNNCDRVFDYQITKKIDFNYVDQKEI